MKKIISLLACVCLLLTAIVIPASAADSTSYVVADTVSTGTAYKFGMIQEKVSTTDVYYINGTMAQTYYLGTTTDASAALDVYLEEAAGGYYLSTTIDGAKKYINMVTSGTHVNGKYQDSASTVYTFNAEKKALVSVVNGEEYWIGTRNDKTFTTVGPVKVSYNGFYCQLYVEATTEGGEVTPPPAEDDDEEVTPPTDDSTVNNIVLTVDTLGLTAQKYTDGTATVNGAAFEWSQIGNYGDGVQVRDKADGSSTSKFWNTAAFAAPIKEIKLVYSSTKDVQYANPDAEIFSFGNEMDNYTYETKLSTEVGVKEYTITPDAETYTFLKFEHDWKNTFYWDSITIVLVGGQDVEITPPATDDKEEDKTEDEKTEAPKADAVETPVAGTAYKYALIQENLGKVLYITGEMDAEKTYYMATTENVDEAADVYLEETTGGYYVYALVGGVKKYMNIVESEGNDGKMHINAVYGEAGVSVFTQNTEKNVFVTKLGEDEYAFGTYNTFNTVSPSNFNKYPDNFWCKFYAGKVETTNTPSTEDKKDDTTTDGATKEEQKLTFGVVEQPEAGKAYKFGMYQANLKKTLYITGEMDGFYMATTDDVNKAADVYLEQTTGGYYIYALVNGAKKYLGITEAEGTDGKSHINAVFTDKPASVFTYNATLKTYVTKVGDREFTFGTRNDKNYDTVSPSETKYTENFVCKFFGMTVADKNSPSTGDAVGSVIAMTMAIAAVMVYTSKKR